MGNALGDVLARLKSSLTLTLTRENVLTCATRVGGYVRELHGRQPSGGRQVYPEARRGAATHLWGGRPEVALRRMPDLSGIFQLAEACAWRHLRREHAGPVERAEKDDDLPFSKAETASTGHLPFARAN